MFGCSSFSWTSTIFTYFTSYEPRADPISLPPSYREGGVGSQGFGEPRPLRSL